MNCVLRSRMLTLIVMLLCTASLGVRAQTNAAGDDNRGEGSSSRKEIRGGVRSVTIPVTVVPRESKSSKEEMLQLGLTVVEDGEHQELLSARGTDRSPLALALLIQDNLISSIGGEIDGLASFIRHLPPGSRVLVGYLRPGSLQVRQRFTNDLERAAKSLRIPTGSLTGGPSSPYEQVTEALKRFESLPIGRRALMLVSDGLDLSRGLESSTPSQSIDLQRAINDAQRRSVAVYSIYAPTVQGNGNLTLVNNGQSSLVRLSEETGGKAFFQGSGTPVSFDPFLHELAATLNRQFALTYLSTHSAKGFHRLKIETVETNIQIRYPAGYTRK